KFVSPTGEFRYGFNGKENDVEGVNAGEGLQDYGLRIYNPSLGKFLSRDPLSVFFPWNSPYAFAEGDVIRCIDLEGGEKKPSNLADAMKGVYFVNGELRTVIQNRYKDNGMTTEMGLQMAAFGVALLGIADGIANAPVEYGSAWKENSEPGKAAAAYAQIQSEGGMLSSMFSLDGTLAIGPIKSINNHIQTGMNANMYNHAARFDAYVHGYSAAIEIYMIVDGLRCVMLSEVVIKATESLSFAERGMFNDGNIVGVNTGKETVDFLNATGKEASILDVGGGQYEILARPGYSRAAYMEEVFHMNQLKVYGGEFCQYNQAFCELEAQYALLELGKKEGWSRANMRQIKRAKKTWQEKYDQECNQKPR
ncbi:MAG: RHS repeat domain-containing protein, partial [Bacteroidia bacterium]